RRRRSWCRPITHDEFRPAAVRAVARRDRAALGLDEALGDGQPEAGAGPPAVAVVGAIELVEQPVKGGRGDAVALVAHDDLDPVAGPCPRRPGLDLDAATGRRIFGGIVEKI